MDELPPPPPPLPPPDGDASSPGRRVPWGPGEAVLVGIVAFIIGVVFAAILVDVTGSLNTCGPQEVYLLCGSELGFLGTVLFWLKVIKHAPVSALGLPKRPLGDVATGVVAGLVFYVAVIIIYKLVVELVTLVIGHQPLSPQQVDNCVKGPWLVLVGVGAVLLAPLGEETMFRGMIFQGLRSRFRFWPAAILNGVLFGLFHAPLWLLMPSLATLGVGLAYVYNRRQSLLASMAAHATFNLIGITFIVLQRR